MHKDEKFWDRIASKFDRIESGDIAYKIFIEKARAYFNEDDTIIDFGCGTGLVCNEVAEYVGFIHAIDISTKMIEIAINKAAMRKIRNIEFERTTIFDEKFKEGSIDVIIAFNIFHLLEEPQKYFQRLNQILKPGGFIISSIPCMSEAPFFNKILKFFSLIGLTPKLNSFTSAEIEQNFIKESFKLIEISRFKPKSPQYFCLVTKSL